MIPTDASPADLRTSLAQLLAPLRETALETSRLLRHLGGRLDALSLDLARDVGAVTRDAQALATAAHGKATTLVRATPRAARLAQAGAALLARHRWLRLAAAARGAEGLRDADHRELARRTAAVAAQLRGGIAKLGQLASCRPDLVGPIWASELAALQDDVPPIETAAIRDPDRGRARPPDRRGVRDVRRRAARRRLARAGPRRDPARRHRGRGQGPGPRDRGRSSTPTSRRCARSLARSASCRGSICRC